MSWGVVPCCHRQQGGTEVPGCSQRKLPDGLPSERKLTAMGKEQLPMDHLQNVMGYFDQQQPLCAEHDRISKDLYKEFGVKTARA